MFFFVISGFLITRNIYENFDSNNFSFVEFFGRRVRRIFPALILVMTVSLILGWFTLISDEYNQLGEHVASGSLFIINFVLSHNSGYFDSTAKLKPMLHLWSLSVEEQFYIIWPLVLWCAWKYRLNLLSIGILLTILSFFLNFNFVKRYPIEVFFWPVGRVWEFLVGGVLAWLITYKKQSLNKIVMILDGYFIKIIYSDNTPCPGKTIANICSFLGITCLIFSLFYIKENFTYPGKWCLIPVFGALLIIIAGTKAWLNKVLLCNPLSVWFGLISYPLYLWHWPILSFLNIVYAKELNLNIKIIAIFLSILFAWITYKFIELPIRFGNYKKLKSQLLIIIMLVVGSVGLFVNQKDGVTSYNSKFQKIVEARGDWEYPKGLVSRDIGGKSFFTTSTADPQIIFIGDSHIEQYGPRVTQIYSRRTSKEVVFITGGGCPPIPHIYEGKHQSCLDLFKKLDIVLKNYKVETIIIGGAYNYYLSKLQPKNGAYDYYYENTGIKTSLSSARGVEKAKESFYNFLENLSLNYKTILLLDSPADVNFDPKFMLNNELGIRSIPLSFRITTPYFFQSVDQINLEKEMIKRLSGTKVILVHQSNKICPEGKCMAISQDGKPYYKDGDHMRPWFVKEKMDVLDQFIIK